MSDTVSKQILKNAIEDFYRTNKINSTTKSILDTYVDAINRKSYHSVGYSNFDQASSDAEITFDDVARNATNAEGVDKSVVTSAISLSDITVKGLKLSANTTEDVEWFLSADGANWISVTGKDMCEVMSGSVVYVKVTSPDNVISNITIVYEENS